LARNNGASFLGRDIRAVSGHVETLLCAVMAGFFRPSTPCVAETLAKKHVDARNKRGHNAMNDSIRPETALIAAEEKAIILKARCPPLALTTSWVSSPGDIPAQPEQSHSGSAFRPSAGFSRP
jgi:hypothetical protein